MPIGSIQASLRPASARLQNDRTTIIPATLANELVTALNGKRYIHRTGSTGKRYGFYRAVLEQVGLAVGNTAYEWWPQVNGSQPVGNTWNTDPTRWYSHPRKAGGVVAVRSGNRLRYLSIATAR